MTDTPDIDTPEDPPEPEVPASPDPDPPTDPPPPVAEPAPVADPEPEDSTIPETLRPYVRQLRDEAAERRIAVKAYEEAFTGYGDDEKAAFLEIASGLASEDIGLQREAAERMAAVAKEILGPDGDDPNRPLTRSDLERIEAQKQADALQEKAVQEVISEAKALGYEEGKPDYAQLMWRAQFETKGDLKAAHEAILQDRQAIIDQFAESVRKGSASWPVRPTPNTAGAVPDDQSGSSPKTWAESRAAAKARAEAAYS